MGFTAATQTEEGQKAQDRTNKAKYRNNRCFYDMLFRLNEAKVIVSQKPATKGDHIFIFDGEVIEGTGFVSEKQPDGSYAEVALEPGDRFSSHVNMSEKGKDLQARIEEALSLGYELTGVAPKEGTDALDAALMDHTAFAGRVYRLYCEEDEGSAKYYTHHLIPVDDYEDKAAAE